MPQSEFGFRSRKRLKQIIVYNHKVHMTKNGGLNTRKLSNEKVYSERVLFPDIFFAIRNKE